MGSVIARLRCRRRRPHQEGERESSAWCCTKQRQPSGRGFALCWVC